MDRTETPALGESRRHQLSPSLQRPRRFSTLPLANEKATVTLQICYCACEGASAVSQSCSTANNIVSESDLVEATGRLHTHLAKQRRSPRLPFSRAHERDPSR
jgi:hypothetical protein